MARLKGSAKSIDLATLLIENKKLLEKMGFINQTVSAVADDIQILKAAAGR